MTKGNVMYELPENAVLFVDSAHGVYVPSVFFHNVGREYLVWDCDNETRAWILQSCANGDPNVCEDYWEAWARAEEVLKVKHPENGKLYTLYQDGDLWLVPVEKSYET